MTELPQYHFDREDFINVWKEVFGDRSLDVIECCVEHTITSNFELWCDEFEEYYIRYIPTGVTINWYNGAAHLGRTNTCTDANFTLGDFKKFLTQLKEEIFTETVCTLSDDEFHTCLSNDKSKFEEIKEIDKESKVGNQFFDTEHAALPEFLNFIPDLVPVIGLDEVQRLLNIIKEAQMRNTDVDDKVN